MQESSSQKQLARHVRAHPNLDARIRKSEHADGSWTYEIRYDVYDSKTGATKRKYEVVGPRLDQAKKRFAQVTASEERNASDAPKTVAELIERYRATHKVNGGKDAAIRLHILPRWGSVKMRDVRQADIAAWWPSLKRQDGQPGELDDGSKGQILAHFSSVMQYAVDCEWRGSNPVRAIPQANRPQKSESRRRILSFDEETRLLAYTAPFPWLADIIVVGLNQGLRLRELLGLQWEDVDFTGGKLRVCHALNRDGTLGGTKHQKLTGKRDPRDVKPIDLMPATREILLKLRMDSDGTGYVFRNQLGRQREARDVQRAYVKAVTRAALPVTNDGPVTFHSLRHTAISRLANNAAIPLVYVRDFAGHSDLSITSGYVHGIESSSVTEAAAHALSGAAQNGGEAS